MIPIYTCIVYDPLYTQNNQGSFFHCSSGAVYVPCRNNNGTGLHRIYFLVVNLSMYMYSMYIYIYKYIRVIIPVRRWAKCHACQPKWVSAIFQNAEKLFSHFRLTSSSCQDQMRLLVPHKSCRCYSHFCTTAKHSALTLCQAFCAMLQQRELEFFCKERHHLRSIKDVFMCKERHHLRSIKDVFRCKERHHPHPTPPQTTPLWPPANGYNHGYIYI